MQTGHENANNSKALAIAAKLTMARVACRLAQSVHITPQLIDIDTLIQPRRFPVRVLRATRGAKNARIKPNRPVRRAWMAADLTKQTSPANGPSGLQNFQGATLQRILPDQTKCVNFVEPKAMRRH
jgi:hypothetical protein